MNLKSSGDRPYSVLMPANLITFAQAPKKAVASPALQKEFDGFIGKFRAALKVNDSAAVRRRVRTEMTAVGTAARSVSLWAHDPLKTGLLG